jgi:signal transduction histidine kinase
MTRLMVQMNSGMRGGELQVIELAALLREVVSAFNETLPLPTLECTGGEQWVSAHREQLANVFHHLIQNAGEATDKQGRICVRLSHEGQCAVVEIEDNGVGMSQEFIKDRLFKPFDSTKGLTGMGIGAFESRELLRSLGGSIEVRSEEGAGSCFRIMLPCAKVELSIRAASEEVVSG